MNNGINRKRIVVSVISALILLIGVLVIFQVVGNNHSELRDIHISVRPKSATPTSIFNEGILIGNFSSLEIDLQLPESTRSLTFTSPGFQDKTVQLEGSNVVISLDTKNDITTEELIIDGVSNAGYIDFDNTYKILNPKVYGNNEWAYGVIVEKNTVSDGEQVVVKISGDKKEIVFAGTDFNVGSLMEVGVPENVAKQIIEDSNDEL